MAEAEKNCKLTLYLDTPKMFLRPGVDNIYIRPNGTPTTTWFTGHAFVGLTDEQGNEQKWGYYPEPCASLKQEIHGCHGIFEREDGAHYNEAVIYPVSREQYDAAMQMVNKTAQSPGFYQLFGKNCSSVASSILRAGGVENAPTPFLGLTPHRLTLSKRAMRLKRKLEVAAWKAKNAIKGLFTGKKAPTSDLLNKLKEKPIPVSIKEGMKACSDKKPLDMAAVIRNLAGQKDK